MIGDTALFDAQVIDAVQIPLLPFRTPVILQSVALDREDFMRTHEMPRRVYVPVSYTHLMTSTI